MAEDIDRQPAHGIHRHGGEYGVPALRQRGHEYAQGCVKQGERRRSREKSGGGRSPVMNLRQRVGRPFEGVGHGDGRKLGQRQQRQGEKDAPAQVGAAAWPDIGSELNQRPRDAGLARRIMGGVQGAAFLFLLFASRRYRAARPPRQLYVCSFDSSARCGTSWARGFRRPISSLNSALNKSSASASPAAVTKRGGEAGRPSRSKAATQ